MLRYDRAAVAGCAALWTGGLVLDVMVLPFAALCTLLALFVMAVAGGAPRPLTAATVALGWELIRAPRPLPRVRWLAAAGAGWVVVAGLLGWSLVDTLTEEDGGLSSALAVAVPAPGCSG